MRKSIKYFQIVVFILAGLEIIGFMNMSGLNMTGRYQYHHFPQSQLVRTVVDLILITSLAFLVFRKWNDQQFSFKYQVASMAYLVFIIPDVRIWLWLMDYSPAYYYIIIWFTLPLIIFLIYFFLYYKFSQKVICYTGIAVILAAFIFDIIFIGKSYKEAPNELYERMLTYEQVKRMIYYCGLVILVTGLWLILEYRLRISNVANSQV